MSSKFTFETAKIKLESTLSHLSLIEFSSYRGPAKILDQEYGEFECINFREVLRGGKKHPERSKKEKLENFKKTNLERCGYETNLLDPKTQEQIKQTNLKNIGVEFPFQSAAILEKAKQTNLKNLGVEYPTQSSVVMEKVQQTVLKNFGVKFLLQNQEIKEKVKKTNLENLGVECSFQSEIVKDKIKKTNLENLGCENPMQNAGVVKKAKQSNIINGKSHNIDGYSASDYYKLFNVKGAYTTFIQNINEFDVDHAINYDPSSTNLEQIIAGFLTVKNIKFDLRKHLDVNGIKYYPDFVIEEYKLIIECDGLYWHSDANQKNDKYHQQKKNTYNSLGYKSLFFRSDEIINKTEVVKSIINSHLNLNKRIFARKCKVEIINTKDSVLFFGCNHLMGKGAGKTYGLVIGNDIVCAMRVINKTNHLEISRFCSKLNTTVVGGLSKLFKHVIADFKPKKIISFVDARYGDGSSLIKNNFKEMSNNLSFKWTDSNKTFHRMVFKNNTGYDNGLHKIWDCGQKKFELIL